LINGSVGYYRELASALQYQDRAPKETLRLARNLSVIAINLQWVIGEAEKAESSFFKINQQAAPIAQTELEMIKARRKPNAVAARALIGSLAGTGTAIGARRVADHAHGPHRALPDFGIRHSLNPVG
jgi:hypothetical protein